MSWIKLDDQFAEHPKIVQAGPLAAWLHVKAIAYCNRYLTDGAIPYSVAMTLVSWADVEPLKSAYHTDALQSEDVNARLAGRLVECGLWDETKTGFEIHDYLVYQPSKQKILAEREAVKNRVSKFRNGKRNASVTDDVTRYKRGCNTTPDPDPDPEKKEEETHTQTRARVDCKKLQNVWLKHTGVIAANGLVEVAHLCEAAALVQDPPAIADEYAEAAVLAFVEFVRGCSAGRKPALSPPKFLEHFEKIQELVKSKNGISAPTVDEIRQRKALAARGDL